MRLLLSLIVIAVLQATGILATHSYVQTALADKINCGTGVCLGTQGSDTIIGDNDHNFIYGCGGDDVIVGNDGNDIIRGEDIETASDAICSEHQSTVVVPGADRIEGGAGNDIISHSFSTITLPDGHKDIIDCGPGEDIAYININDDKDVAENCETVHTEND